MPIVVILWNVCCASCNILTYMQCILLWCYDMYAVHFMLLWHICYPSCCDVMMHLQCILCVVVAHMYVLCILWCYGTYIFSASCCDVMAHIHALHLLVMLWWVCSAFCCDVMSHIYAVHLLVMLWNIYRVSQEECARLREGCSLC